MHGHDLAARRPARRLYRGIEIVARKSVERKTVDPGVLLYSSLRGNYDGEVSSIEAGQTDPGVNADFDYAALLPQQLRPALPGPASQRPAGRLLRDALEALGGPAGVLSSPALLFPDRILQLRFLRRPARSQGNGRKASGDLGSQPDARLPAGVGPVTVTAQLYVFNLFNNQIRTSQDMVWSTFAPPDYPISLFDPNQEQNNPEYRKITGRQEPRLVRGAIRISF